MSHQIQLNPNSLYPCCITRIGGTWHFIQVDDIITELKKEVDRYQSPKQQQIRAIFAQMYPKRIKLLPIHQQIHTSYEILRFYPQMKWIAIEIILANHKTLNPFHLEDVGKIIDTNIADQNSIEFLSKSLFVDLLSKCGEPFVNALENWKLLKDKPYRIRACISTFAKLTKEKVNATVNELANKKIWGICETCIRYDEKIVKVGVGCALKELCLTNENKVVEFVRKNRQYFSKESLRHAVEKIKDLQIKKEFTSSGVIKKQMAEVINASNKGSDDQ